MTVLSDFEDRTVAADVVELRNLLPGDAQARWATLPARGKGALSIEISATQAPAGVTCALVFREPARFAAVDRVATYCWLNDGEFEVAFRLHDARGQSFESAAQTVNTTRRWVAVTADAAPDKLKRITGNDPLTPPIEISGYVVTTRRLGQQTIFLDDLEVEHRVEPTEVVRGEFAFAGNAPTHLYEAGSNIDVQLVLENQSRQRALNLTAELSWLRPNGDVLETRRAGVNLPASGTEYRARQKLPFSQVLAEPGLYRLVARVRAPGWTAPYVFETAVALAARKGSLARGRSAFFGLASNLLREPEVDQSLEISVAADVGANLLALEVPWSRLEPKSGSVAYALLDAPLDTLDKRGIAALLVLSEPPAWLPADRAQRQAALVQLVTALSGRYRTRLTRFQFTADALGVKSFAEQAALLADVRTQLGAAAAELELVPPALPVADAEPAAAVGEFVRAHPDTPLMFTASGEVADGLKQFAAFRERGRFDWRPAHRWCHEAAPLLTAGYYHDAEEVLRAYLAAAQAGVGGLIWSDLRDDDNDPRRPEAGCGLVRRDFSPKSTLLGYLAVARRLTGFRYAGPVAGCPDEFDSALFIGGDRQVALLLARPNRVLPAVVAPVIGVPGELYAEDFESRPWPLLSSAAPPLIATDPRPLFVWAVTKLPEPLPQLGLSPSWLRVPRTVFAGAGAGFTIEATASDALQRSNVQLMLPPDAPVTSSFNSVRWTAAAEETLSQPVTLTAKTGATGERAAATLRVSLEGTPLDVPLEVRLLHAVHAAATDDALAAAGARVATLAPRPGRRATADVTLSAGWSPTELHLLLLVKDDAIVSAKTSSAAGDRILVGAAGVGAAALAEAACDPAAADAVFTAARGVDPARVAGWRCRVDRRAADQRAFHVTIPAAALDAAKLARGQRVLLAVWYVDDDADGFPPVPLVWGEGLDGPLSSEQYQWLELAD